MLARDLYRNIVAKVAAYQVVPRDIGKLFTNRGATASITFTLPAIADLTAGWWCEFYGISATGFVISAPAGKLVALNNAAAGTLTMTTTSRIIGAVVRVEFDGTSFLVTEGAGATYAVS